MIHDFPDIKTGRNDALVMISTSTEPIIFKDNLHDSLKYKHDRTYPYQCSKRTYFQMYENIFHWQLKKSMQK